MKAEIRYIELKTGYNDNGPAWIGKVELSKTGKTIYFNDKAFRKYVGVGNVGGAGNYYDVETQEEYWISCVKKDGSDRHWAGSGKIIICKNIVSDYLEEIGQTKLKPNFQIVDIPETYPIERIKEFDNKEGCNKQMIWKKRVNEDE